MYDARREFLPTRSTQTALSTDSAPPFPANLLCPEASSAPSPPARRAPDWCKCSKWLSLAECAVRALLASAQIRDALRSPSFAPPVSPASAARISLARQLRRQTARHNSEASRSSAPPSRRCPLPRAAAAAPARRLPQLPQQTLRRRRGPFPPMARMFRLRQKNSAIAQQPQPHRLSARFVEPLRLLFRSL